MDNKITNISDLPEDTLFLIIKDLDKKEEIYEFLSKHDDFDLILTNERFWKDLFVLKFPLVSLVIKDSINSVYIEYENIFNLHMEEIYMLENNILSFENISLDYNIDFFNIDNNEHLEYSTSLINSVANYIRQYHMFRVIPENLLKILILFMEKYYSKKTVSNFIDHLYEDLMIYNFNDLSDNSIEFFILNRIENLSLDIYINNILYIESNTNIITNIKNKIKFMNIIYNKNFNFRLCTIFSIYNIYKLKYIDVILALKLLVTGLYMNQDPLDLIKYVKELLNDLLENKDKISINLLKKWKLPLFVKETKSNDFNYDIKYIKRELLFLAKKYNDEKYNIDDLIKILDK